MNRQGLGRAIKPAIPPYRGFLMGGEEQQTHGRWVRYFLSTLTLPFFLASILASLFWALEREDQFLVTKPAHYLCARHLGPIRMVRSFLSLSTSTDGKNSEHSEEARQSLRYHFGHPQPGNEKYFCTPSIRVVVRIPTPVSPGPKIQRTPNSTL